MALTTSNELTYDMTPEMPVTKPKVKRTQEQTPKWFKYPVVKQQNLPREPILRDIESHLPLNHPYRAENDKVHWAHEGTHGINAHIRNLYIREGQRVNAAYCLQNRAIVFKEPAITLAQVRSNIPQSMRGATYDNLLARDWQNRPLYVFDEWAAYVNGTAAGLEMAEKGTWRGQRWDTVLHMLQYNVYAIAMIKATDAQYRRSPSVKAFMKWQSARTIRLYVKAQKYAAFKHPMQVQYVQRFRLGDDTASLREFAKSYFGKQWMKEHWRIK